MFLYPEWKDGVRTVSKTDGLNADMLMDVSVHKLDKGGKAEFSFADKEVAVLLTEGKVRFISDGIDHVAERKNVFDDAPTCVHAPRGARIAVEAATAAEFIVVSTLNERTFPVKLYKKEDIVYTVSCEGLWENTAVRDVNTVFDYDNAPYSNLVIGEVLARQGRWWSYVPHSHPQPEVYYYKFKRPEGFGACFIGEEAHTVKDGSAGCFPGGKTHVQVTAPCFPMYCCWIIRHLDGNPWLKTRIVHPDYTWIDENPKFVKK